MEVFRQDCPSQHLRTACAQHHLLDHRVRRCFSFCWWEVECSVLDMIVSSFLGLATEDKKAGDEDNELWGTSYSCFTVPRDGFKFR